MPKSGVKATVGSLSLGASGLLTAQLEIAHAQVKTEDPASPGRRPKIPRAPGEDRRSRQPLLRPYAAT